MKKLTSRQNLRSRTLIMLAVGMFVLSSCGGPATEGQAPEPTTVVAVPTTPPLPTPTIDLSQARKTFEAGGELTYGEVVALRHSIVGDPPHPKDFKDSNTFSAAVQAFEGKGIVFSRQLAKCKLKESIGWVSSWRNEYDKEYKDIPGLARLYIFVDDPYSPAVDNYAYPELSIVEIDEKDTSVMRYGQRIRFSGMLSIVDGQEAVTNATYQLLGDDYAPSIPTPDELKDLRITLKRTGCYGTCPGYTLTITGDGKVNFEGRNYTRVKGSATTTIDQDKLNELIKEFLRVDFFNLQDKYSANVTDNPTYTVSIQLGGKTKEVENYAAGPRRLYLLQDRIDQIVNSEQWIK